MEEKQKLINSLSIKNGLIIGGISVVLSLVMYFVDPLMAFTNWWIGLVLLVVFLALLVYSGQTIRKEVGGFWTFGEAFKSFLIMGLIITAISTVYNVVLMKVIDPDLPARAGAAIDENTRTMMAKFITDEDQLEEALAKSGSGQSKLEINGKNLVTGIGVSLAMYGVLSLILAAIMKKNPPIKLQEE
ncbi:MAG: DUF4199 domain-containing protein [Bacteroidota bacterium]